MLHTCSSSRVAQRDNRRCTLTPAPTDNVRVANWPGVHLYGMSKEGRQNPWPPRLHTDAYNQTTITNNQQLIGLLLGNCSRDVLSEKKITQTCSYNCICCHCSCHVLKCTSIKRKNLFPTNETIHLLSHSCDNNINQSFFSLSIKFLSVLQTSILH